MIDIRFLKMHGSGNDFVVFDNRLSNIKLSDKDIINICDRHRGIGADGLLFVENGKNALYMMRYFNADGGEVLMCGNGARCIGFFIYLNDGIDEFQLETLAGIIDVKIIREFYVKIGMPIPYDMKLNFSINGFDGIFHFVRVGVPHLVKFVDDIDNVDVYHIGKKLRYDYIDEGTNVNFVKVLNHNKIKIRTYERGVENETQSCGTGATASAIISNTLGLVNENVKVNVQYPEPLEISFEKNNPKPYLSGPVSISFRGEIRV